MIRSTTMFAASLLCGALMMLGGAPEARASTVVCESHGGATQACSVNTSGGVRLTRQLSSQGCWQTTRGATTPIASG